MKLKTFEMLNVMNCNFEYTGDTAFRDSTLLPFGKEILDYYRLHWPLNPEGKHRFTPFKKTLLDP